ncbi:sulfotransferase [Cocleimonas flava]|uniref:Sulfotransferase family protein n=1 Tax=Cocleimonas flava TaxID=634765 RepID=A0A4R1F7H5_9GAMM|nr:sulfotransferase [Cocleimonas flava]TCJ88622.1 sulfotransferase family protein [Cocleimonas flava]
MDVLKRLENEISPIAIGGVGGSGTRLLASCLEELNYYIGSDLNKAKDNLWFTLLFKHIDVLKYSNEQIHDLLNIFLQGMLTKEPLTQEQQNIVKALIHEHRHLPVEFFQERANSLFSSHEETPITRNWAWKEPNTHIILDRLVNLMPNMKYIHVMRNGLDMAHSANQNQQFLWGEKFIGKNFKQTPHYSLKYWCIVHKRLLEITKSMGSNFLLINYDNFCINPGTEIPKLLDFLNVPIKERNIDKLKSFIKPPVSIGRYKQFSKTIFDQEDIDFVETLGFNT